MVPPQATAIERLYTPDGLPPDAMTRLASAVSGLAMHHAVQVARDPAYADRSCGLAELTAADDGFEYPLNRHQLAALVADNCGAQVLSPSRLEQIFGHKAQNFRPVLYSSADTVRVQTADGIRVLMTDGHHRASGCHYFYDEIAKHHPGFVPTIRDLTSEYLTEDSDSNALTMAQYLRLVVPPTMEQEQIASRRLAALLLVGWDGLVGREISTHFTSLAALSLLDTRPVSYKHLKDVRTLISEQPDFFDGNTSEQRDAVRNGLFQMARVIADAKLQPKEVAAQVFSLIASGGAGIGGVESAQRQVMGLFGLPLVAAKLDTYCQSHGVSPEAALQELADEFRVILSDRPAKTAFSAMYDSIVNPEIAYEDTVAVIKARKPAVVYGEIKRRLQDEQLEGIYTRRVGCRVDDLSILESQLLKNYRSLADARGVEQEAGLDAIRQASVMSTRGEALLSEVQACDASDAVKVFVCEQITVHTRRLLVVPDTLELRKATAELGGFIKTCRVLLESALTPTYGEAQPQAEPGIVTGAFVTPETPPSPEEMMRRALGLMALALRQATHVQLGIDEKRVWTAIQAAVRDRVSWLRRSRSGDRL